jgi:hypothetical protein
MTTIGSVSDYIILVLHLTVFLQVIRKQVVCKLRFCIKFHSFSDDATHLAEQHSYVFNNTV